MNDDKLFLVAVGGTGMRCLESFVYLCAMGMMDNKEIEVLTIDTDSTNGNKQRSELLINHYLDITKNDESNKESGRPNKDTFFSARINLYKYSPNYSSQNTFESICSVSIKENDKSHILAKLFLDPSTAQKFNLAHGYRAQTHLGSLLMYHSIIDAARQLKYDRNSANELEQLGLFIDKLKHNPESRVFILGSIFGGTGASAIPIIPEAFRQFVKITSDFDINFDKTKFGATLLTQYFSFKGSDDAEKRDLKNSGVIADSLKFSLNSQAALDFYNSDPTVEKNYKKLYHIGWPFEPTSFNKDSGKTLTGGKDQENPPHVMDLLAAGAAYNFFTIENKYLENKEVDLLYNSVEVVNQGKTPKFKFEDILGVKDAEAFEKKARAFFFLSHLVLNNFNGASKVDEGVNELISNLENQNIKTYSNISKPQKDSLNIFLKEFGYSWEEKNKTFSKGWIYSLLESTNSNEFLFPSDCFPNEERSLKELDLVTTFRINKKTSRLPNIQIKSKNKIKENNENDFINELKKLENNGVHSKNETITTNMEKFLNLLYSGITSTNAK